MADADVDSAHLVTTFDSGGSSAVLRKTFAMPAVGDLRNRLLSLADPAIVNQTVLDLCDYRIPADLPPERARAELASRGDPSSAYWASAPADIKTKLSRCLRLFFQRMPPDFDARGANFGNLFLTGVYLELNRDLLAAVNFFRQILGVRSAVAPIVGANCHLGARLLNGDVVVGQHRFKSLPAPIRSIFLTVRESPRALNKDAQPAVCRPPALAEAEDYIRRSAVLVFPMGSFYSSLAANLLPAGVGRAVAAARGAKVFIPNSGRDPELRDLDVWKQTLTLVNLLRDDAPNADASDFLRYILIDSARGVYPGGVPPEILRKFADLGVRVIDREMIRESDPARHDPEVVLATLLDLAREYRD